MQIKKVASGAIKWMDVGATSAVFMNVNERCDGGSKEWRRERCK